MLALSSSVETTIALIVATVVGACILGIGRAAMKLYQSRQMQQREDIADLRTLSMFLFDQPQNPRTGTPATQGWTTRTDRTLESLTASQHQTAKMVNEVLYELKPNGGGNFRGAVEQAAAAAGLEVDKQVIERTRVQTRDQRLDRK